MTELEKVIKELEDTKIMLTKAVDRGGEMAVMSAFNCFNSVKKTLVLLKEQEARILDWDELEDWGNAVWFEDNDEHECYIALIANVGAYDAKFTNVEPGNIHSLVFMRDFYMKEWRCWSARPTIKQRQAVKWE